MPFKKTMVGAFVGISLIATPIAAAIPANAVTAAATEIASPVMDDNFQQIQEVFNAINVFRASKGLQPVTYNVHAANVAQDWSNYMGEAADFSHNPNFSTDPRVSGNQYSGEIIAARWDRSGQALVNQWINSPGHNAIMSDPNFTTIGIGITYTTETGKTFEETGQLATYGNVDFYRFVPNKDKTFTNPLDAKNNINPLPISTEPTPVDPIPTPTPTPTPTPNPTPVLTTVVPPAPVFNNEEHTYTLLRAAGIRYLVNGVAANSVGTFVPTTKTVKITAEALTGYQVNGTSSWEFTYTPTATLPEPVSPPVLINMPFSDVSAATPFANEINWMRQTGISTGWSDNTYRPFNTMDRGSMAAFLYRSAGSPEWTPPAQSPFVDLTPESIFYKEITWMAAKGITTGWPDKTFRQFNSMDRGSMAAFLYRLKGSPDHVEPLQPKFVDVNQNSPFHKEISWMSTTGITTGWPDQTFRQFQSMDRATMAAFLYRASKVPDSV